MTRGVAGMTGFVAKAMISVGKGGRTGHATVPEGNLRTPPTRTKGQREE